MARAKKPVLTLTETAERLGVHYMTAYKYVRTGRLPARKVGQEWIVDEADVVGFERERRGRVVRGTRRAAYPNELEDRLLAGDEPGAWTVVERAMSSGMDPSDVLLDLVGPAMSAVGDGWERGEITVADEHRASATATRVVGRLGPQFARRGRKRGHVIVGAAPGDTHALPTAILRDLLQGRGFTVSDLGGDVPIESWSSAVRDAVGSSPSLVGVGICATTSGKTRGIRSAVAAIRRESDVPIVLGGHGVPSEQAALRWGADRFSASAIEAVDAIAALASSR